LDRQLVAEALGKVGELQVRSLVQGRGARGDQGFQPRAVNVFDLAQVDNPLRFPSPLLLQPIRIAEGLILLRNSTRSSPNLSRPLRIIAFVPAVVDPNL